MKAQTRYTATINDLGFRDPSRSIQKPENVFRIIALGAYHTFGHAVNDENTYPRQLEAILNGLKIDNISFEVWNGGRHSASAIVGLARLQTEILDYQPDLIVWDYGFVDSRLIYEDKILPVIFLFPKSGIYLPLTWILKFTNGLTSGNSMVIGKFAEHLVRKYLTKNTKDFIEVNKRMLEITEERNIPVILLRQKLVFLNYPVIYQKLSDYFRHAYFVDAEEAFKKYPPLPDLTKEFYSGPNWLSEYDPALGREEAWWPPEYFTDIYQYNKWGHRAIARYLADEISAIAKKTWPKNRQYKSRGG